MTVSRRDILSAVLAGSALAMSGQARAQSFPFKPNQR